MDFSRADSALMSSSGIDTSISFLRIGASGFVVIDVTPSGWVAPMLVVRAVRDLEARRWSRRSPAERAAPCHLPDAAAEGCDLLGRKSAGFGVRGLGKLGSEDFTNAHGGLFHVLVLPDPEDSPSQGVQMSIGLTIPFDVAREFRRPPCGVVRG